MQRIIIVILRTERNGVLEIVGQQERWPRDLQGKFIIHVTVLSIESKGIAFYNFAPVLSLLESISLLLNKCICFLCRN